MAETKWTPGPWTFAVPSMGFSQITGPRGELIFGIAAGGIEEKQPDEICEANARLIVAAPELYERLAILLSDIAANDVSRGDIEAARAALAKARGEEP